MNRRSFFRSLGVAAIAAGVPDILTAVASDRFRWKARASGVLVLNPAWVDAQYEIGYWCAADYAGMVTPVLFERWKGPPSFVQREPYSMRLDKEGRYVPPELLVITR